jgi:WhiB family transcriptional regulator, redox-sensing transcriptional regulator
MARRAALTRPVGGSATAREREAAKHVCQSCPVLDACREWALGQRTLFGVLGGMTPGERGAERRRRKRAAELDELPVHGG